jgi:hypothetical protein
VLFRWLFSRSAESFFGDLVVLAFLFAQAGDGVLTYIGLAVFGPAIEGNPLIAGLMGVMGAGPALASVKLLAGSLGIFLHLFGAHRLIAVLTGVYVALAVAPWTAILLFSLQ